MHDLMLVDSALTCHSLSTAVSLSSPVWPVLASPNRLSLLKMIYDMVNTIAVGMYKMVRQLGVGWRGLLTGLLFCGVSIVSVLPQKLGGRYD